MSKLGLSTSLLPDGFYFADMASKEKMMKIYPQIIKERNSFP